MLCPFRKEIVTIKEGHGELHDTSKEYFMTCSGSSCPYHRMVHDIDSDKDKEICLRVQLDISANNNLNMNATTKIEPHLLEKALAPGFGIEKKKLAIKKNAMKNKFKKIFIILFTIIAMVFILTGCGPRNKSDTSVSTRYDAADEPGSYFPDNDERYIIVDYTYSNNLKMYTTVFRDKYNNTMYLATSFWKLEDILDHTDLSVSITQLFNEDGSPMLYGQ